MLVLKILFVKALFILVNGSVQLSPPDWNSAIDPNLVENALDSEECERQLMYIRNNASSIRMQFLDASWRVPRNILGGNTRDLGSYLQCLDIYEKAPNMNIEGKYCSISLPLSLGTTLSNLPDGTWGNGDITGREHYELNPWLDLPWEELKARALLAKDINDKADTYERVRNAFLTHIGVTKITPLRNSLSMTFNLAVCVPKVCRTQEALSFLTNNLTGVVAYTDNFCRLNNDKPWVAADTVAMVVISVIGILLITSTAYDIWQSIFLKRERKEINKFYQSFSIFTNTKIFFTFPSGTKVVTCMEGIRSIAMLWVLLGHSFQTQMMYSPINFIDILDVMLSFSGLWINASPITVDTFFLLSGILLVYTSASRMTRRNLLQNIHLFYLNRILRMLPVLAFSILVTASFLHRLADGPNFGEMETWVNNCRATWWLTLLYVQNWVNPEAFCLSHTWYLAIDMQLYIVSPFVLYWVLGPNKRSSWIALLSTLTAVVAAASVYNFKNDFQSGLFSLTRDMEENMRYMHKYYYNTLTRAAPFIVGMITGYLLHIYREKKVQMSRMTSFCLWVIALAFTTMGYINTYWTVQLDWDNQLIDNLLNSYVRLIWAIGVGWIIFACHNGYGGPVNWILSLYIFKILGRLSYAMYIVHYPLMFLTLGARVTQLYFTMYFSLYRVMSEFWLSFIASFLMTILIDIPFSNLIKIGLEGRRRKPVPTKKEAELGFK